MTPLKIFSLTVDIVDALIFCYCLLECDRFDHQPVMDMRAVVMLCCIYRDMFCAGRVVEQDMKRTIKACGGAIMTTAHDLCDSVLGTCKRFEERQIGAERLVGLVLFCDIVLICSCLFSNEVLPAAMM